MNYAEIVNFLAGNLGFQVTDLVILLTFLGCIIIAAKDFKIALICLFLLYAVEFMIFESLAMETYKVLLALLLTLVILTLSLYTSGNKVSIA